MTTNMQATRVAAPRHAYLLLAGSCLPIMATVLIAPVLPQIMQHFSGVPGHEALVPLALTTPALLVGLLGPVAGLAADRHGRKRLLLAALLLYSVFGCAPLFLDTLPAIIASRAGVGMTEAFIMTSCTALIADYYDAARRERYLTLQTVLGAFAATLFFGIGGALGEGGWRTPFWMYLAGVLLLPLFAWMLWEPKGGAVEQERAAVQALPPRAFPWRAVAAIGALTLMSSIAFYLLPVHLGLLLSAKGVGSAASIGLAMALASAATVAGAASYRPLSRRGVAACLLPAWATLAAGFLMVACAAGPQMVTAGGVVAGYGGGLALPTLLTWMMRQLRFEERGRGSGVFMGSFFFGHFVSPLVVIGLGGVAGGMAGAIGLYGLLMAAAALAAGLALLRGGRSALPDRA
ncbi:MFS transporter [Oxalobacteraceae bacterium A2-2]